MDAAFEGAGTGPGVEVWRIEDKKPVKQDPAFFGKFYEGDSYIVLLTYVKNPDVNPDKLDW